MIRSLLMMGLALWAFSTSLVAQSASPNHHFGLVPVDPAKYRQYHSASYPLGGRTLPASVDLSDSFPVPSDQEQQDSCTAWALGYFIRSYQQRLTVSTSDTASDQSYFQDSSHLFSPAYLFKRTKTVFHYPNRACTGGISFDDALYVLSHEGIVSLKEFPYIPANCNSVPTQQNITDAASSKIAGWSKLGNDYGKVDFDLMKALLATGFPIAVGITVDQAFIDLSTATYAAFRGPAKGYHAIVVIGYDTGRQAFLIQNSWGRTWGDNGRAWVPYSASKQIMKEAYVSQGVGLPEPDVWPQVTLHLNQDGSQSADSWFVVAHSFNDLTSAQKAVVDINSSFNGFVARVYPDGQGSFLVSISSNLSREAAIDLRQKALSAGFTDAEIKEHK